MKQQLLFDDPALWRGKPLRALTAGALRVWNWMTFRGGRERKLWWSQEKMRLDIGVTLRSLQRYIAELVSHGVLTFTRRGRASVVYNLLKTFQEWRGERRTDKARISITETPSEIERKPAAPSQVAHQRKPQAPPAGWTNELAEVFRGTGKFFPPAEIVSALYQAGAASGNSAAGMALFWMERACDIGTRSRNARNPMLYACGAIKREFGVAA